MERILIEVHGLQEAHAALAAVRAHRAGALLAATADGRSGLPDRLYAALAEKPLPEGSRILLEALLQAPSADWVPLDLLEKALVAAGYAAQGSAWGKVRAGLAGVSWLLNTKLQDDTVDAKEALSLLVQRQLFTGKTRYRLTDPGRTAIQRLLHPQ